MIIDYLTGTVHHKTATSITILCSCVGYLVNLPTTRIQPLEVKSTINMWIYHHITEGNQQLYGFVELADRELFGQLISVNGVGPKMALNIMSAATTTQIKTAIRQKDLNLFRSVSGIGPKNAQRIIIELQNKMDNNDPDSFLNADAELSTVYAALKSLGYQQNEITSQLQSIDPLLSPEEKIRHFLKSAGHN